MDSGPPFCCARASSRFRCCWWDVRLREEWRLGRGAGTPSPSPDSYACVLLRRRRTAAMPARPVASNVIDAGSGTVVTGGGPQLGEFAEY